MKFIWKCLYQALATFFVAHTFCWLMIEHLPTFDEIEAFTKTIYFWVVFCSLFALFKLTEIANVNVANIKTKPKNTIKQVTPVQQAVNAKTMKNNESKVSTKSTNGDDKIEGSLSGIQAVNDTGVRFSDIAGYETTKKSIMFMVSCLKNPQKLSNIGAKIPKGILFSGSPGTGKTFFAKAIAGEAGVPFFSVDGTKFNEVYVGLGARNVRSLFEKAKENAPCVVFIDEIDAVGGARSTPDSNSERRNTLNALLVALDGMDSKSGVLVIAATNTPNDLDPALVRAGRFDRKIVIPMPTKNERKAIINIYLRDKKVSDSLNIDNIASQTVNFSGAMIATLVNEAALHAVRNNHSAIEQEDFDNAYYEAITKGEKKEVSDEDRKLISYHEAGHALIAKLMVGQKVPFLTNITSTSGYAGFAVNVSERLFTTKRDYINNIKIAYGGRAAEEVVLKNPDDITSGATADIKDASKLVKDYFEKYGNGRSLLDETIIDYNSEEFLRLADDISSKAYQEVVSFLKSHRIQLDALANELYNKRTLYDEQISEILSKTKSF